MLAFISPAGVTLKAVIKYGLFKHESDFTGNGVVFLVLLLLAQGAGYFHVNLLVTTL